MTVLFLAKAGKLLDKKEYIDEEEYQFLIHIKYLADKKSGLWYHGWSFDGNHNFAEVFWARGNCWITAGIPEFLEITGDGGSVRRYLTEVLSAQAEALLKFQDKSGMWHTLIDDENSYLEASATAGFAFGILKAVRLGVLGKEYVKAGILAAKAIACRISVDGSVRDVSYGTGMSFFADDYRKIPIVPMAYGNALAIFALNEMTYIL